MNAGQSQKEIHLRTQDQIPYEGVLVPLDQYREYQVKLDQLDEIQNQIIDSKCSSWGFADTVIMSLAVGLVTGAFLVRH